MTRASRPRFGSSKGVSTIIGAIFFVLVAFVISTNVFLWTMTQNTLYNQAVKESRQMDADRFSERVVALIGNFTVPQNDTVQVDVTVFNEGPVSTQVITAWVVWVAGGEAKYGINDTLNISLNPGETLPVTIRVDILDVSPTVGAFSGWLVTARGNLVPLERERGIIVAELAQGIGSISMEYATFRYYEPPAGKPPAGAPSLGTDLGSAKYSFTMPSNKWTVFAVELINLDESGKDITLYETSCIWLLSPPDSQGAIKGDTWYITRVVDNKLASFTPQVLKYKTPTTVYFGPWFGKNTANSITAVNILLFGKIGDDDYGQNIPFISIYVTG